MADPEKKTALINPGTKYPGITGPPSVFKIPSETVLICFQKYPGIHDDAIIKDGPEAEFTRPGLKSPIRVKPVGGIYTINMPASELGRLNIFRTDFNVRHCNKNDLELNTSIVRAINNWLTMHEVKKKLGQIQRLQMLGYYEAPVVKNLDALYNREYERASLNFQAHTKKLFLDGIVGSKTCKELEGAIDNNKDASGFQHIRICLVRFKRYVKGPVADAMLNAPHPDDRGGLGAVIGVTKQDKILTTGDKITPEWIITRVHLERTGVDVNTQLYIDSDSPDSIQIVEPAESVALTGNQQEVIKFAGIKETKGSLPRVRVRYGNPKGPIIGEMEVNVSKLMVVKCAAYRMTILGSVGAAVAGDTTKRSEKDIKKFFQKVNAIWRPLGIEFKVKSVEDQTINLYHHGWLSNDVPKDANGHDEHDQMWIKYYKPKCINVFFVPRIRDRTAPPPAETWDDNTLGQGWSRKSATNSGPGFQPGVTVGDNSDAQTVAHELGHVLQLTRHPQAHSDQKNKAGDYLREDSWSRARLMAMYANYNNRGFQNIEYGWSAGLMKNGCLLTIRNYGKYDLTDNELRNSRQIAKNPY